MQELEKILQEIEKAKNEYPCACFPWYLTGLSEAEKIIRKHMNDGWIPVKERLPEKEYDTVLCVTDKNHYFVGVYNQEYGFRTGDIDAEGK